MKLEKQNLEDLLFDYAEQIKILISPEIWENVLLECSKNEILVLMLLYRNTEVHMGRIAEYIGAPLNTVTGIISRMEKKDMVCRVRSEDDKRVVTIELTKHGRQMMQDIIQEFLYYGGKLLESLTLQELEAAGSVLDKVINLLKEERKKKKEPVKKKIKKITIQ